MSNTKLFEKLLLEQGCICEDCRSAVWDKVIQIEGR